MRYYIEFPINYHCNLKCPYCFHQEFFQMDLAGTTSQKYRSTRPFSLEQYRIWRDAHLTDATEIVMHLHGGEPFHPKNVGDVFDIIEFMDKERIDLLSNGLQSEQYYLRLKEFAHKFRRIGFTFHRTLIANKPELVSIYERNVLLVKNLGIPVYVKELLFADLRNDIVAYKNYWRAKGVDSRIQDFKGTERGKSKEEYGHYTPLDHFLVSPEYKHKGNECCCQAGYKNVLIRGFDMLDVFPQGGDVVACWHDPTVVGNIIENWYEPNYRITKDRELGRYDVKGVPKLYRGTYDRDMWEPPQSACHG